MAFPENWTILSAVFPELKRTLVLCDFVKIFMSGCWLDSDDGKKLKNNIIV